ncbi:hypothetical protein K9M06_02835 [Candidatus Bipolaricaulota bacterium]|nr:hypothetical protein [Candidatus Bipolaricaulota bacterium]
MSHQKKIVTMLIVLVLSIGLVGGLAAFASNDVKYKTYESEEFGFSIRYPVSWEKTQLPKKENEPQIYQHTSLHLHPTENLPASVTIYVTELTSPASLKELKRYLELRPKFDPWRSGLTDARLEKFADSRAVLAKYDRISFYEEKVTDESGSEKTTWKKSRWKGTTRGIIRNSYLYRISAGALLEDYEKAKKKYLSKILDSFEFTK